MEYNGAAIIAMTGKNCVAIARCVYCLPRRVDARARARGRATWRSAVLHVYSPPPASNSDTRLGVQGQTVSTNFQKVFKMHDHLMLGLAGLASDVQTLCVRRRWQACGWATLRGGRAGAHPPASSASAATCAFIPPRRRSAHVRFRMNMYKLREERDIKPATFGHMVSAMLYEKRCV